MHADGSGRGIARHHRRAFAAPVIGDVAGSVKDANDTVDDVEKAVDYATNKAAEVGEDISAGAAIGQAIIPIPGVGAVIGSIGGAIYAFRDEISGLFEGSESKCMRKYGTHWDEDSHTCGGSIFKLTEAQKNAQAELTRKTFGSLMAASRAMMIREAADSVARGFAYKPYILDVPGGIEYETITGEKRVTVEGPFSDSDYFEGRTPALDKILDAERISDAYQSSGPQDGSEYKSIVDGWVSKNRPLIKVHPPLKKTKMFIRHVPGIELLNPLPPAAQRMTNVPGLDLITHDDAAAAPTRVASAPPPPSSGPPRALVVGGSIALAVAAGVWAWRRFGGR